MNTANRARIARKRAQRLGLQLTQRGTVFTLKDDDITAGVAQQICDLVATRTTSPCLWGRWASSMPT